MIKIVLLSIGEYSGLTGMERSQIHEAIQQKELPHTIGYGGELQIMLVDGHEHYEAAVNPTEAPRNINSYINNGWVTIPDEYLNYKLVNVGETAFTDRVDSLYGIIENIVPVAEECNEEGDIQIYRKLQSHEIYRHLLTTKIFLACLFSANDTGWAKVAQIKARSYVLPLSLAIGLAILEAEDVITISNNEGCPSVFVNKYREYQTHIVNDVVIRDKNNPEQIYKPEPEDNDDSDIDYDREYEESDDPICQETDIYPNNDDIATHINIDKNIDSDMENLSTRLEDRELDEPEQGDGENIEEPINFMTYIYNTSSIDRKEEDKKDICHKSGQPTDKNMGDDIYENFTTEAAEESKPRYGGKKRKDYENEANFPAKYRKYVKPANELYLYYAAQLGRTGARTKVIKKLVHVLDNFGYDDIHAAIDNYRDEKARTSNGDKQYVCIPETFFGGKYEGYLPGEYKSPTPNGGAKGNGKKYNMQNKVEIKLDE